MAKRASGQNWVTFMIFTLITVVIWIGFDVYRTLNKKSLPDISEKEVSPFNPSLDTTIIDLLKDRLSPPDEALNNLSETKVLRQEEATSPAASLKPKIP